MKDKFTLLVADDSETDVLLLTYAVSELGERVNLQIARDGAAVISYLLGEGKFCDRHQHPLPDLIRLDLRMPGLNGIDVLQWLQSHPEFTHIPRVIMSGSGLKQDAEACYCHGADGYFVKPGTLGELRELLREIISYWSQSPGRPPAETIALASGGIFKRGREETHASAGS
jgi:CheY-like chemotaxis protein